MFREIIYAWPLSTQNQPVSDITPNSATFNGMLVSTGSSATAVCVLWGATDGGSEWGTWAHTNWFNDGNPNPAWTHWTPFSTNIILDSGTGYYYTFGASNDTANFVAPSTISFFTPTLPVVTNLGAVARRTVQLKGQVLDTGGEIPTCWFAWWEDGSATTNTVPMGTQSDQFSTELTGLDGETTYGFFVVASNNAGVVTSGTQSFTTFTSDPITWYAATNGTDGAWTNWATAGTNLQEILDVAEGGDTIHLAGHTFWLTNQLAWTMADLTIRGGYDPETDIHDPEAFPTVLARSGAGGYHRVMYINGADNGTLAHVTVRDGYVHDDHNDPPNGGGLYIANSQGLTLNGCAVLDNTSHLRHQYGGGIYATGSDLILTNCVIAGNTASATSGGSSSILARGGGIWSDGTLTIYDSTIEANHALGVSSNGEQAAGGALWFEGDSLHIQAVRIKHNLSRGGRGAFGGGLYCDTGDITLRDVVLLGNRAVDIPSTRANGGGMLFKGSSLTATNVLLAANNADSGDGLYVSGSGTVDLHSCTVADHLDHGIYRAGGAINVINSIFWDNGVDIEGAASVEYSNLGGGYAGNDGNINADPLFEYGYYLGAGSPCIGTGSGTAASAGLAAYTTRTDGAPYADPGDTVSMGWHFLPGTVFDLTYTNLYVAPAPQGDDANTGTSWGEAFATLTKALATARDGSRIHVAAGVYDPATETFPLNISNKRGVEILGTNTAETVIDADGVDRVLVIETAPRTRLQHITITGGSFSGDGGGLYIDNSQNTWLSDCVLSNNTALGNSHTHGGGIYALDSAVVLTRCVVANNEVRVSSGGSSSITSKGGGIWSDGKLAIRHTVITNNHAWNNNTQSAGGGIYFIGSSLELYDARLIGNQLSRGNRFRGGSGAGLYSDRGRVTMERVIISGNDTEVHTSLSNGGGIWLGGGSLEARNVLLADNTANLEGDGLYVTGIDTLVDLINSTVAGNSGEGIRVAGGTVSILNGIVWGNGDDIVGAASLSHSLYGVGADVVDGGDNIVADPLFVDAAEGDYRLQLGSPAIDAGLNQSWMAEAEDLAGLPRIMQGIVDMGCYETIPPSGTLILLR